MWVFSGLFTPLREKDQSKVSLCCGQKKNGILDIENN